MIVLETDVIGELLRPLPDQHVLDWLSGLDGASVFVTAITESELRLSVALLPDEARRATVSTLLDQIIEQDFSGRILPFDGQAAKGYAAIAAGSPALSMASCQVAAIALACKATIATGNTADLAACGIPLINPWTA